MATGTTRMSADQRRAQVLRAAVAEFSRRGYEGTSTEAIAKRAGISQPYLFRLFSSKKDLYLAAQVNGLDRIAAVFEQAAEGLTGDAALDAMGNAYTDLISDRDLLMLQLQLFASCHDEDVRDAAKDGMDRLWELAARISGKQPVELVEFFAFGMLCNVVTAIQSERIYTLMQEIEPRGPARPGPISGD